MASAKVAIRLSIVVVVIVFSLCSLLSLVRVLYQAVGVLSIPIGENSRISGKYFTLQEAVGSCPSEHSTPSLWSDTLGTGDAVADVSDEASGCHCCFLCMLPLYLYYRHNASPVCTSNGNFPKVSLSRCHERTYDLRGPPRCT